MSLVTQISGSSPEDLWRMAALPVALALDLALGDVPGRAYPALGLRWLIGMTESMVRRAVDRLGGGRGGDLFGGACLGLVVVAGAAGPVWLLVDVGDTIGGAAVLAVRAGVIAAGLIVRATGDAILNAAEAPDRSAAATWLARAGGVRPPYLERLGAISVGVAAAGELLSCRIVAPLFWLVVGGPAALWGFIAIRSLRETMLARDDRSDLDTTVVVGMADAAEAIPTILSGLLVALAAGITRALAWRAARDAWRTFRADPRTFLLIPRAALAGALGVRVAGGRIFAAGPAEPRRWLSETNPPPADVDLVRAVRLMQVAAILATGLAALAIVAR